MLTNLSPVPKYVSQKCRSMEGFRVQELAEALESAGRCIGAAVIGAALFTFIVAFLLGGF